MSKRSRLPQRCPQGGGGVGVMGKKGAHLLKRLFSSTSGGQSSAGGKTPRNSPRDLTSSGRKDSPPKRGSPVMKQRIPPRSKADSSLLKREKMADRWLFQKGRKEETPSAYSVGEKSLIVTLSQANGSGPNVGGTRRKRGEVDDTRKRRSA